MSTHDLDSIFMSGRLLDFLVHDDAHDDATLDDEHTIETTSSSPLDASTAATSPSPSNLLTPGSAPPLGSAPTAVAAIPYHDTPHEEFPNPFEHLPPRPFHGHTRTHSEPALSQFMLAVPQVAQRTPSVLRPSHPRFKNSIGSQRASMAISAAEFGTIGVQQRPHTIGERCFVTFGDERHSLHSVSSVRGNDHGGVPLPSSSPAYRRLPKPSHPASHDDNRATGQSLRSSRSMDVPEAEADADHHDPQIHVSRRFEEFEEPPRSDEQKLNPPRQPTNDWPVATANLSKKTPRWKFWPKKRLPSRHGQKA
ncbi:hypothetical protein K439DRAFT_1627928 [Ramaria rubella]|nr:hypothetical protein K439DRAFT_1627928 [Ramaria rubella]